MSLAEICWWTFVRTVLLCLMAWPVCRLLERCLKGVTDRSRFWLLTALLAPACFPELMVGYALRDYALARPVLAECLCSLLLFVRIVPVGVVALLATPASSVDAAAIYCRRLLRIQSNSYRDRIELARCYWHGPVVRALPALALMSIVAFQEFELAALLQTISWTDWFVTAERLGWKRHDMLWQALWPLVWQLPVLVFVVWWMGTLRDQGPQATTNEVALPLRTTALRFGSAVIIVFVVFECVFPLSLIGWRMLEGLVMLSQQRSQQWGLTREMTTSAAVSICAGVSAWMISGKFRKWSLIVGFPGLFGSLLLSLGCVALFQQPWLRPLYDTPLPWVLTLIVWLLPRAMLLRLWLHSLQNDESIHAAKLVAPGHHRQSLLWRLRDQPRFLAASLLCYWAYCDLPTAYLLAPTGMASGLVRLYNFMHFGRSAALSAESCVFFGVPLVCLALLTFTVGRFRR